VGSGLGNGYHLYRAAKGFLYLVLLWICFPGMYSSWKTHGALTGIPAGGLWRASCLWEKAHRSSTPIRVSASVQVVVANTSFTEGFWE